MPSAFQLKKEMYMVYYVSNGSGKSTTLGMILKVLNPTSGSWLWFGSEPTNDSLKKIGAIIEKPQSFIPIYRLLKT